MIYIFAYQQLTEQIQENNMMRGIFHSGDFQIYFFRFRFRDFITALMLVLKKK